MDIRFLEPQFLLLLLALPLVWFVPRRLSDVRHGLLRSLVFALVILALASPVRIAPTEEVHQVVIADMSTHTTAVAGVARDVTQALPSEAHATVISIGAGTLEQDLPDARHVQLGADTRSPLSTALEAAARSIPDGARGAITVVSDGLATDRHWATSVQDLGARGVPVHTIEAARSTDVAPVRCEALGPLRVGQTARVGVDIIGYGTGISVALNGPDGELDRLDGIDCEGRATVVLEFEPEVAGFLAVACTVEATNGSSALPESDELKRTFAVQDPLRVLYLGERMQGGSDRVGELLGRGFEVTNAPAGASAELARADLVLLDDRPAESLPASLQEEIARRVTEDGLGLLAAGGSASFGPGGFQNSALSEVLPVEFIQKEEKRDPSTTLCVIIDTSGSMGGNRVQLAKEVSRLAIRRLLPHDKVGIVEFFGAKRWAAPIQPASNSIELERALNRLDAGGGTVILPAIEEAFYGLQNVDTRYKHVLVLTDGGVEQGAFEPLLRRMAEKGINVSTVLIGPDAHSEFLVTLANWGKGRFYSVPNRFNLPEILLKQPASAKLPAYRPATHQVSGRGGPGWWGDVDPRAVPALAGYVETRPRPGAEKLLETAVGAHPVLATWRYGLGRVTTMTTEPTGPGTETWREWDGYGPLLARVLTRTASDSSDPYLFTLTRAGHALALTAERRIPSAGKPEAVLIAADGEELGAFEFRERADGLWEAGLAWPAADVAHAIAGAAGDPGRLRLVSDAFSDVAPEGNVDPELALDLELLASATGGTHRAIAAAAGFTPSIGGGSAPLGLFHLTPLMLLLALGTYLGEIVYRRRPGS